MTLARAPRGSGSARGTSMVGATGRGCRSAGRLSWVALAQALSQWACTAFIDHAGTCEAAIAALLPWRVQSGRLFHTGAPVQSVFEPILECTGVQTARRATGCGVSRSFGNGAGTRFSPIVEIRLSGQTRIEPSEGWSGLLLLTPPMRIYGGLSAVKVRATREGLRATPNGQVGTGIGCMPTAHLLPQNRGFRATRGAAGVEVKGPVTAPVPRTYPDAWGTGSQSGGSARKRDSRGWKRLRTHPRRTNKRSAHPPA
jgi:hypothetical protein